LNFRKEQHTMQAYQFERSVPASHTITVELPPDAPTGPAQVIVLFKEAPAQQVAPKPRFANIAEFIAWHDSQPPSGRTAEDVDRQIREEREGWSD
jgi:hypothetical protein